jgi:long-chain acyl-CoA synthetase
MVKVRGFQVAPAEIEAVLHADPRVRDCAVFGVEDAQLGEALVAAVAPVDGAVVTAADLQQLVADQLAGYKRVRHVVFVDAVPRLPSGKALRRQLKDEWGPRLTEQAGDGAEAWPEAGTP